MTPERRAAEERVARRYADGILRGELDWTTTNQAIIARWSVTALDRIKRQAWRLVEAE